MIYEAECRGPLRIGFLEEDALRWNEATEQCGVEEDDEIIVQFSNCTLTMTLGEIRASFRNELFGGEREWMEEEKRRCLGDAA